MKVSIAVTTYNGEQYLLEQLDSFLSQTYDEIEVVICDDRSNDRTVGMIENYIESNDLKDKWQIIVNDKNLGYASNFMKAVKLTSGDFIFFADQDDVWENDKVESMVEIMKEHKNIDLLCSDYDVLVSTDDAPEISESILSRMKNDKSIEKVILDCNNIFIGSEGCTMGFRRSFLEDIIAYWYDGCPHDEFVWKMALCRDGCYMYHSNTMKRRLHSNNVSKRKMRDVTKRVKFLQNLYQSHKIMLEYAKYRKLEKKYIELIRRNIESVELRIALLKDKKYLNTVPLAFKYYRNYHSIKSIPVELYLAIKNG